MRNFVIKLMFLIADSWPIISQTKSYNTRAQIS